MSATDERTATAIDFLGRLIAEQRLIAPEVLEQALRDTDRQALNDPLATQTRDPLEVFFELTHQRLGDPSPFELVHGLLGTAPHKWYEWSVVDLQCDPLPQRWIVDPMPRGSFSGPLGLVPNSPLVLLYKRRS